MSHYRSSYRNSKPNPTGWITLLIIIMAGCALCWPLTSQVFNSLSTTFGNLGASINTTINGPQPTLTIAVSPEKADLFKLLVDSFNTQDLKSSTNKTLIIKTVQLDPESMLAAALAGNFQAMSPDSSIWLDQLDREYQAANQTANRLVGQTVRYAVSPVVIAMWRDKAQALGWPGKPIGWSDILQIATSDPNFKWSHPSTASASGLLATLAEFYAGANKTRGLTADDVQSPNVLKYVGALEKTVRYYGEGEQAIALRVTQNGRSYLDAFVASEQILIWANQHGADLVAIYPSEGSLWQDHPLALLEADKLTDLNRETFRAFAEFITSAGAQQTILSSGYRPADLAIPIDGAGSPITAKNGVDPSQPQTALQVPSPAVLDVVRESWLANKRRTNVELVVDTSGSMEGDKLANVKVALRTFIDQIKSDSERVGMIQFFSNATEAVKINDLKYTRSDLIRSIDLFQAGGDTALLDGVSLAYDRLQRLNDPERINAIVVMTDGKENASNISLNRLINKLRGGSVPVVVFAIAYGGDADMSYLRQIADATNGQTYQGTIETIRQLYKILSTYF
jgi:Ca-activated chloride channel family protein